MLFACCCCKVVNLYVFVFVQHAVPLVHQGRMIRDKSWMEVFVCVCVFFLRFFVFVYYFVYVFLYICKS